MGLESAELLMEMEDEFGIDLPDNAFDGVRTVADLADAVYQQLAADQRLHTVVSDSAISRDQVAELVRVLTAETLNLPQDCVTLDSNFYRDLGAG